MTRILIVENDEPTADFLTRVIKAEFPDWMIDNAYSIPEALENLRNVPSYDFAILDFRLRDAHGDEVGDLSVCLAVRGKSQTTRVIHITAFADDEMFRRLKEAEKVSTDADDVIVKNTADWMEKVVARLRTHFHSDRIQQKLEDLLPTEDHSLNARYSRRAVAGRDSVTNRLADLCMDTSLHWRFLTPSVKQLLQSKLVVDASRPDNVRVSLIRGREIT